MEKSFAADPLSGRSDQPDKSPLLTTTFFLSFLFDDLDAVVFGGNLAIGLKIVRFPDACYDSSPSGVEVAAYTGISYPAMRATCTRFLNIRISNPKF